MSIPDPTVDDIDAFTVEARNNPVLGDPWYIDVVRYLRNRTFEEECDQNYRRRIIYMAHRYSLQGIDLFYRESDGKWVPCIMQGQVRDVLTKAHDLHGHFSVGQTLRNIVGRVWWPTRVKDTQEYVRTCEACQKVGPLRPSVSIKPIVQLQPFDMCGLDFVGKVTPASRKSGYQYLLVFVDYFSRFVIAKAVPSASSEVVVDFMETQVKPMFGLPRALYTDNGAHFTGGTTPDYCRNNGIVHFTAPVSDAASVGLVERVNQLIERGLVRKCVTRDDWEEFLPEIIWAINTRCIRVHGYSPAQILFGYNANRPVFPFRSTREAAVLLVGSPEQSTPAALWNYSVRLAQMDELRVHSTEELVKYQQRQAEIGLLKRRTRPPRVADLVLRRRTDLDNQRGRKLEPRWTGPLLVVKVAHHGRSCWLHELGTPQGSIRGRFQMNHLKVYCPREESQFAEGYEDPK
ncbi:hypothetical protein G7K_6501-t1 [Saitoella complicata NRRL Y-17804]|uniref:Integrase catalytic domain-containing protein n=1 Tax=Saitoella complicata (strain BCRC 22490 / CBS 7301 / JCM 7358 / NBRC 10748 / NRRL Y-17804) TaxID=698492 RepID=A0A0E9NRL8_SAICN|nr:hypothetical protein G7K_6501-t1 [Saitoella complicata NRRL Y-17804]